MPYDSYIMALRAQRDGLIAIARKMVGESLDDTPRPDKDVQSE